MSHKHFDDTGHDIVNYGLEGGNAPIAYMPGPPQGQPQYVIYQPIPMGSNPGGMNYPQQYAPQMMVPIPIQVATGQGQELATSSRKQEDLDYFLNRSDKQKVRRYRSRSGSKSAGEISDSPVRTHRSRSVSKSVGKGSTASYKTDKNDKKTNVRPENPFRKRNSKSPSPKRVPDNPFRKSRARSRSREKVLDKIFKKKLRPDSRDNIKTSVSDKFKKRQLSPLRITAFRRSRSRDKKRSPDSSRRKRRRSSSQKRRSGSHKRHSSSNRDDRRERHKTSTKGPSRDERFSERSSKIAKTGPYSHEQSEKRDWLEELSPERRPYIPDDKEYSRKRDKYDEEFLDDFHDEFSRRDNYREQEHSFDYERRNEHGLDRKRRNFSLSKAEAPSLSIRTDEIDYSPPRQRRRESYSPVSDDERGGIGLKIHLSQKGRWIEDKARPSMSPPRTTKLMVDGVLIDSHDNELRRGSPIRERARRPDQTRYVEDDVEVFYDGPPAARGRRRSWDDTFEFEDVVEDVSDSDSFDSQKDYRELGRDNPPYMKDDRVARPGNASYPGNPGFDKGHSGSFVSERINVQNLCIDYNNDKQTCGIPCRYLHLCKFFILGTCKFGDSCKKNHDILSPDIFAMLRKQNPRIQRSKFVVDKVKEILFARFTRNKPFLDLHMPETKVEVVPRSPSVESIKSVSEESVGSIDSFDARYYTADFSVDSKKVKTKTKEEKVDKPKTENTDSDKQSKTEDISKNENECVVVVNIDNNETAKEKKDSEEKIDDSKVKVELEICDEVTNDKKDSATKINTSKIEQDKKDNAQIKSLKKVDNSEKTKKDEVTKKSDKDNTDGKKSSDKKTVGNDSTVKKETKTVTKTVTKDKAQVKKSSDNVNKDMAKKDTNKKVEVDSKGNKAKPEDQSKLEKGSKSRSLSPVSVENIEDWDKLDRYDRVSEDGMSDGEHVTIVIDDDLESISSNESDHEREKELEFGPDMIKKIAVPIGMNDPLVFSSSVKTGDATEGSQTSTEPSQTGSHNTDPTILTNVPPPIFPPPMNFNVPPPMIPTRFPPIPVAPLFPAAGVIQNQSNVSQSQLIPPSFPNQRQMVPNLRPMIPNLMPPMAPNPMQLVPPNMLQQSVIPPGQAVNHLPSPDVLKEVIGTLTKNQEVTKNESEAKKAAEATKQSKNKVTRVDTDLKEPMKKLWQFPHKSIINMSIIEFVTETEAYKDEMVAEMVKLLVTIDLPYVTLKKLKAVIKEKVQINIRTPVDLRKILELYPENFQIIETVDSDDDSDDGEVKKNIQIKARLKLGFCSKHGYLPFYVGKCDCQQLHLCKFYFLSHCPNKNCKFGHKLKTDHNINTLKHHRLHRMTGEEIMEFLRDIDSRNIETVPGVCKFYNSNMSKASGCYKGDVTDYQDICHNLHLCFYYVKGKCLVKDCQRSHSIRDTQPNSLLKKYGLDPDEFGEEKILDLIAQKTVDVKKRKEEKAGQFLNSKQATPDGSRPAIKFHSGKSEGSKTSSSESGSIVNKAPQKGNKSEAKKKPSVKFPSVCKFFNNPSGCKKKDWGASGFCLFLHVCQKYVNGTCRIGQKCKRPHSFFSGEPAALITRYGIDLSRLTEQEIMDTLTNSWNALTELPMIGDDENSEEEKEQTAVDENKGVPSSTRSSESVQMAQGVNFSTSQQFSSHNIDEVLQHIMKERGNTK